MRPFGASTLIETSAVILILVAVQNAATTNGPEGAPLKRPDRSIMKTFDFGQYLQKYHKSYKGLEAMERSKYFFGRTLGIFKHNLLYVSNKVGYFLKQSEYTDMKPRELNETFKFELSGLDPVKEAQEHPDLPADQLWSIVKLQAEESGDHEGLSMSASLTDELPVEEPRPAVVNFLADDIEGGQSELLDELRRQNVDRKHMAQLLSLSTRSDHPHHEDLSERSRRMRGIKYRPVVEANNKNFDPNVLPSQGILQRMGGVEDNLAEKLVKDVVGNLIPESVKTVYKYFTFDDYLGLEDYENEDDFVMVDHKGNKTSNTQKTSATNEDVKSGLQYDVDWRMSGCISRPRAQGSCNSCYAFAVLSLMEFFYCYQKKSYTEFSAQYIVDCGAKAKLNGCQGGKLSRVGMFIKKYGIQLESYYPYRAVQDTCPFDDSEYANKQPYPLMPELKGWRVFQDMAAWYKWLPKSPVVVGINMPGDFLAYGGGVHDGSDCVPGMVHAMLLVGSGTQDGHPFWLIKNTFSDNWGEDGYFRLSKKAPLKCFNAVVVARADFNVQAS